MHEPVWGISHLNCDQNFPLKWSLSDLEGKECIVSQDCLVIPAVSFPDAEWIVPDWFLCYHGGFPCPPRSNTDKPSITAAANIRPGSPGGMKAWAVGHFARTTKLTAGTQMRVGKESSLSIQRVFSLSVTQHWVLYELPGSFISHIHFHSHFIHKEMRGQRIELSSLTLNSLCSQG